MNVRHKRQISIAAIAAVTVASLAAGCGTTPGGGEEFLAQAGEELSSNANTVLGFENTSSWSVTAGSFISLRTNSNHTQGKVSVSVNARGTTSIRSSAIGVSAAVPKAISLDLLVPSHGMSFTGSATLSGECASKGLLKTSFGQKDIRALPTGKFSTLTFSIPSTALSKLAQGCSDLRLSVTLSVPTSSSGNYLLDNIQLGGPPAVTSCVLGDVDAGEPAFTHTSTLTRPDLGTFQLQITKDPWTFGMTQTVTLNGNPLFIETIATFEGGSSYHTAQYFSPISPHFVVSNVTYGTLFMEVDGRFTIPVPVDTDPTTIQFSDGGPPPAFTIDPNIADAIQQIRVTASKALPACAAQAGAPDRVAASDPHFGNLPVSGAECHGCEAECSGEIFLCSAAALGAGFGCGPFAPFCTAAGVYGCISRFRSCQSDCHRSGTECCPVACGSESAINTVIGGCCHQGDSCGRRSNGEHDALCCGPGTNACGGELCCLPGEQCATPFEGPKVIFRTADAMCCTPQQMNYKGECCGLGACTTSADCSGTDGCSDGCCTIG